MKRGMSGVLLCLWIAGVAAADPPQHEEVRQIMGTLATVQVWAADSLTGQAAADSAFAAFVAVDSLMSTWNGNSPLSRLNAAVPGTWVPVGGEVCEVLSASLEVARLTGGAFDPTVLPLVKLWGFRGGQPALPDSLLLKATLAEVGFGAVEVGETKARLHKPDLAVDLGGIAKGHALDRAEAALRRAGATGGVLDLGGNLKVFGTGPGREVGIVDPADPEALLLIVPLSSGSVATSGQYERFVAIDGQPYGHILDPRTGWPVASGLSATIIAPKALWADALATAVVVLGMEPGLALIESLPGIEGIIVGPEEVRLTSGLAPQSQHLTKSGLKSGPRPASHQQ